MSDYPNLEKAGLEAGFAAGCVPDLATIESYIASLIAERDTLQLIVSEQGECPQMGYCIAGMGTDTPHKDLADATLKTNRRLVRELEKANDLLDCIEANASGSDEPESWPVWVAERRIALNQPSVLPDNYQGNGTGGGDH